MSGDTEKNKPRTEEMISLFEAKEVEQEETKVYETSVSSRLAEVQNRAIENEITETVRAIMPMMLSRMSGVAEEMSARLQKELPKTLIDGTTGKLRSRAQPCVRHAERLFFLSMYK